MNQQWFRTTLLGAGVVALVAAGCGDDDDSAFSAAATEETPSSEAPQPGAGAAGAAAYCAAEAAVEVAPVPDTDSMTPDEETAALQSWALGTMQPLVEAVVTAAPTELATDLEVLSGALDELIASGDTAAFGDPTYIAAADRVHQFDVANCGWNTLDVTASEYAFAGIPEQVPAGVTSFDFTNGGMELHEVRIFRKVEGVTDSAEQIFSLPDEQLSTKVEAVGTGEYAPPGEGGYFVAELAAGEYFAVCFIPVGAMSEDEPPASDAAPHFMEGMIAEFTVT